MKNLLKMTENMLRVWSVQNRTNLIEKLQTEPTQTETARKTAFGSDEIGSFSYLIAWFGLQFSFYQPNQTST